MHDKTLDRSIDEIAETLKNAKQAERGATLLIGAGCSAAAGIPLAGEFVKLIRDKMPARCKRLQSVDYAEHMDALADGERHDLIAPYIDRARINWAHMAIAQLMKHGFVSRILTTNFDSLIVQSCAIAGVFPAVYDLASSSIFKPAQVRDPSVFYLHGQRLGFVMLNTKEQVRSHFDTLRPVFDRAGEGRVWIVAGYSGTNDPVFDHLAEVASFGHNLYWVGYGDDDPAPHVANLISRERCAYFVRGYDADRFFVELARALDCFPPEIVSKPFSHLSGFLELLMPFPPMPGSQEDLKEAARLRIQKAIDTFEIGAVASPNETELRPESLDLWSLALAGKYDEVLQVYEELPNPPDEARNAAAWAHIGRGNALLGLARAAVDDPPQKSEVDRLFEQACSEYKAALDVNSQLDAALYNWGNALGDWARTKSGEEADRHWREACECYAEAVRINPNKHEAFYNWGSTLDDWAGTKSGEEADGLWREACERYAEAVRIRPDMQEAFYNWGIALSVWARTKSGEEADRLWREACERYADAVRINPNKHEAFNNWGSTLDDWARTKRGEEADRLWREACERYAEAVRIEPDLQEAFHNWGNALSTWARIKSGEESNALLKEACERYAEAVRIKPDRREALISWASALLTRSGSGFAAPETRMQLLAEAEEKCQRAEEIQPGSGSYNQACIYGIRGDAENCRKALLRSREFGRLPGRDHVLSDPDLAAFRSEPWFEEIVGTAAK